MKIRNCYTMSRLKELIVMRCIVLLHGTVAWLKQKKLKELNTHLHCKHAETIPIQVMYLSGSFYEAPFVHRSLHMF